MRWSICLEIVEEMREQDLTLQEALIALGTSGGVCC